MRASVGIYPEADQLAELSELSQAYNVTWHYAKWSRTAHAIQWPSPLRAAEVRTPRRGQWDLEPPKHSDVALCGHRPRSRGRWWGATSLERYVPLCRTCVTRTLLLPKRQPQEASA